MLEFHDVTGDGEYNDLASPWQPIETAPRNGDRIDVWLVNYKTGAGRRITNAVRSYSGGKYPDVWIGEDGRYLNGSYYYDSEGDRCFAEGEIREKADQCYVITHWMPIPPGPQYRPCFRTQETSEKFNALVRRLNIAEQQRDCLERQMKLTGRQLAETGTKLEEANAKLTRLDRLFQSLTPGGSEYVNDPERCVAFVKTVREQHMYLISKFKKEADALRAQLATRGTSG